MNEMIFPGDLVADHEQHIPGCYTENGKTYAATLALRQNDHVVPLKGQYVPRVGEEVVGIVTDERFSGYTLELNSPYEGDLSTRETREELKLGAVVACKILAVNEVKMATLVEPHPLPEAILVKMEAVKVPRLIGRNGSMLDVIQKHTQSQITVGKNGYVAISGGDTKLAVDVVEKIERESHVPGLTDRVTKMLEHKSGEMHG
ncbi:hypothetical protein HY572_07165 [Candidatus Micrarchaeota archaeon]|nr:hypothetical protein [Candidatus Micrarchaeota archaeon]